MEFVDDNDTQRTIASIYITTVYFMIATLCTVGYGDISATGDAVGPPASSAGSAAC